MKALPLKPVQVLSDHDYEIDEALNLAANQQRAYLNENVQVFIVPRECIAPRLVIAARDDPEPGKWTLYSITPQAEVQDMTPDFLQPEAESRRVRDLEATVRTMAGMIRTGTGADDRLEAKNAGLTVANQMLGEQVKNLQAAVRQVEEELRNLDEQSAASRRNQDELKHRINLLLTMVTQREEEIKSLQATVDKLDPLNESLQMEKAAMTRRLEAQEVRSSKQLLALSEENRRLKQKSHDLEDRLEHLEGCKQDEQERPVGYRRTPDPEAD